MITMSFRDIGTRKRSQHKQAARKIKGRQEVNQKQLAEQKETESQPEKLSLAEKQRQARQGRKNGERAPPPKIEEGEETDTTARSTPSRSSRRGSSNNKSEFAKLSEGVNNFQKLVRDLETLVKSDKNGLTPEDQWRTTTLLRSADAADRDLGQKFQDPNYVSTDAVNRSAFAKLNRDYHRAHETLEITKIKYYNTQRAEISLLTAKQHDANGLPKDQVVDEDFYDRAMREREKDISEVNSAMHKVNNIYKVRKIFYITTEVYRRED